MAHIEYSHDAYKISGDLNGRKVFLHRDFCAECQGPFTEVQPEAKLSVPIKLDYSMSRDGAHMCSQAFVDLCSEEGFTGSKFLNVGCGQFVIRPTRAVLVDDVQLGRTELKTCRTCGRARDVVIGNMHPRILPNELTIGPRELVRSKQEYGHVTMRHFFVFVGKEAAAILAESDLKGMAFNYLSPQAG